MSEPVPYTDDEAREARMWSNRHGPSNAWTAGNGTAARMIGRLLGERDRLMSNLADKTVRKIGGLSVAVDRLRDWEKLGSGGWGLGPAENIINLEQRLKIAERRINELRNVTDFLLDYRFEFGKRLAPPDHDVAPAAKAPEADALPVARRQPAAGTGDTGTLTDAEREAVEWAAKAVACPAPIAWFAPQVAATLRGLLERLGGAR